MVEYFGMKNDKKNKQLSVSSRIFIGVLLFIAVFGSGYALGDLRSDKSEVPQGEGYVLNQKDKVPDFVGEDVEFDMFWEVWGLVRELYVDQPVSEKDLFYGAMEGLLASLDDPYSVYFTPELAESFQSDLNGTFFGIGAEIGEHEEGIVVVAPLTGSPAEKAGLMAGDVIINVDGESVAEMTVTEAVMLIRGERGTDVVLSVYRDGEDDLLDIKITRDEITINSVEWEMRDDGIAVIEVYMFNDDTTKLFKEAVDEILTESPKGIILDVRNNPGGLLSEAISLAGFWIEKDTAVIERIGGKEQAFYTSGTAPLSDIPTVVLVNKGSASGSEILAGALQDYGYATLIGEQTFGKGSVQEYRDFLDGSAMKVTVAKWLTPKGRAINGIGIEPDIEIEYTLENYNEGETPQFEAALDFLKAR